MYLIHATWNSSPPTQHKLIIPCDCTSHVDASVLANERKSTTLLSDRFNRNKSKSTKVVKLWQEALIHLVTPYGDRSRWAFAILRRSPSTHGVTPRAAHSSTTERKNELSKACNASRSETRAMASHHAYEAAHRCLPSCRRLYSCPTSRLSCNNTICSSSHCSLM